MADAHPPIAIWIAPEAFEQLEALRVRTGHIDQPDGRGHTAVVEWLIRAMTTHYAQMDRKKQRT